MPSQHRKEELKGLLGNCIIVILFAKEGPKLEKAQTAADRHIAELNQDYPGWDTELSSLTDGTRPSP